MRTTSSTGRGAHTNAHANTHANTIGLGLGVEPVLSAPLRPAVPGASGLVFGRALEDPSVPRDMDGWTDEILGVRRCVGLPVFVSRSVRHLERWGGDEEGISGRPSHVSRLRTEFDAGADYDLYEIPPSDLDPHAVSSLFKAYLRQLPEPILTRALKGQFDMAMTATDSTSNASFDISKLPTSMTSFGESSENMRSLDDALLADIKVLIDQLPQANYNLLHELCHLLRYTTEHAHTTKMPIGNLLLLFCPTAGCVVRVGEKAAC
ncbi:RhoGAP domain-containing protein [Rhizoctonia solani AG-1 IA]|uniref:RhoGAP domain-containing protein n=1 Tax=Thanatephorus cucumeris (strain AG1-IA) TaxID=983506 RepID=L8X1Q2_THACA|nr:RhoGAP domain-containing protein [Rhizoctonia solani AG-1 IA]